MQIKYFFGLKETLKNLIKSKNKTNKNTINIKINKNYFKIT